MPPLGEDPRLEGAVQSTVWNKCFHTTRMIWKTLIQDFLYYGFHVLNGQELKMKRLAVEAADFVTNCGQVVIDGRVCVGVAGFYLS